jgi:Amt family ammonium transporter
MLLGASLLALAACLGVQLLSPEFQAAGIALWIAAQVWIQTQAVGIVILWSGIISAILFYLVKLIIGLRPTPDQEREGLDITDHGERAYN